MHFGVVRFPGSNCDQDMIDALGSILGHQVSAIWHKDHDLKGVDAVVLPGGFSYGDYLRIWSHRPFFARHGRGAAIR